MGVSVPILVISISLHLIAFVLAVGAERRRSTVPLLLALSHITFLSFFFNGISLMLCFVLTCEGKGCAG